MESFIKLAQTLVNEYDPKNVSGRFLEHNQLFPNILKIKIPSFNIFFQKDNTFKRTNYPKKLS